MEPQTDPVNLREDSSQLPAAWKALWGVAVTAPLSPAAMQQLSAARAAAKQQHGADYSNWVIAQAGIATQVANRVSMGAGACAATLPLGSLRGCTAFSAGQHCSGGAEPGPGSVLSA